MTRMAAILAISTCLMVTACTPGEGPAVASSQLLVGGTGSVGAVWSAAGIYSVDNFNESGASQFQRIDPVSGEKTVVAWPPPPCRRLTEYRRPTEHAGKVYVPRTCDLVGGPVRYDYIRYDLASQTWDSPFGPPAWEGPPHAELLWDERAKEGLFTTPDESCSSVFRLTMNGPSAIRQVLRTPLGPVDTSAGLQDEPSLGGCLRDGRVLGLDRSKTGQLVLMVSPASGPPGPSRLDEPAAIVLATWSPAAAEPLSDFRTLVSDIDGATAPAWSADGSKVFWADESSIRQVDVGTGKETVLLDRRADQVAASPDGRQLLLRRVVEDDEGEIFTEFRLLDLPGDT